MTRVVDAASTPGSVGAFAGIVFSMAPRALALAVALGACSSADRLSEVYDYRRDAADYIFAAGTETRNVATVVTGNPFGVDPERLARSVASAVQDAVASRDVVFVIDAGLEVRRDISLIVVFDAPPDATPPAICARGGRVPTVPAAREIDITMAFCHGSGAVAGARGRVARGAGEASYAAMLRDMTRRIFGFRPR